MKTQFRFVVSFILITFLTTEIYAQDKKDTNISTTKHSVILKNASQQPLWMQTWQLARKAKSDSDELLAISLYQQLLQEKPNIEEALREYSLLLIETSQWQPASSVVQTLLEINPDFQEYLLNSGTIALHLKQYNRATSNFGQVYTANPNGPSAVIALRGQIEALQKQKHKELAYPLMEQLYLLVSHEEKIIRDLAVYSTELGQSGKAVNYYTTLINEFEASDQDFLNSEELFEAAANHEMALKSREGYLSFHPYYIPFHKKLASYYLQSNQREIALDHLLILIAHGDNRASSYLKIGQIYLYDLGRPDKALYYYDEYRKRIPRTKKVEQEIQRIQAILANDLLVIVENEGAWTLWRDLAKVIPDRLAVYYTMAEQLQKLGKPKELREVLDIIHFHNPGDQDILLQLAQLTFDDNDYSASLRALDSLDRLHKNNSLNYLLRAKISETHGDLKGALQYYRSFIETGNTNPDIILHAMQLAGTLGYKKQLSHFHNLSQNYENSDDIKKTANLLYGEILLQNSLYTTARTFYSEFQKTLKADDPYLQIIRVHFAQILHEEGNYFEAEQALRFLLLEEPGRQDYLAKLVQNSLRARDWNTAWKWHTIRRKQNQQSGIASSPVSLEIFIERITILTESGKLPSAIELAEDYLEQKPAIIQIHSVLAELYFKNENYLAAQKLLNQEYGKTPGNKLLLGLSEEAIGTTQMDLRDKDHSNSTLFRVQQYQKYKAYQQALDSVNEYLAIFESSIQGRLLKSKILHSQGDDFAALEIIEKLSQQYPSEEFFRTQSIKISFNSSKFENVIQTLDPDVKQGATNSPLLTKQNVLLLARAYWAQKKQKKALAIYEEFLQAPVDLLFAKKIKEKQISLHLPEAKRSFFNQITFTNPAAPNRLRVVMSPEYTSDNIGNPETLIATSLYADYRWQKFIQEELSVRQEMNSGNYYQAMKDYQKMLKHNPSMESLFDLAGIYSRLGFLGKEAALYRIIQEKSPGYPYLDEAMQRNRLKRKPTFSSAYEIDKKEGRDGYYDNQQQAVGVDAWYMPNLSQVVTMDYRRIYNESVDKKQDLWRNRVRVEMNWNPSYDIDFFALVGLDSGETDGQSNLLYDFSIKGRLGDMAEGFLSVSQDVVDDTLEALKSGITTVEYEGGLQFDILPRLFAGGKYSYADYSDANYQNSYKIWSAYILHHEPMLLQLRYDYELSHNGSGNNTKDFDLTGIYGPEDHPYWSQKEYWQHQFSISFEHQLTDDVLGRGAPSYYSLGYTFGYEEGGYDNHMLKAKIFLEISRHFLLNSSFEYTDGAEFEKFDSNISLIYRW